MNLAEAADVLAMAAAFDSRTVGKADILAWHAVIGHLDAAEARDAVVAHYTDTRDRIMPVDVLSRVTKLRALRIAHAGPESVPDADPDDPIAYRDALREGRWRTASGMSPRPVRQAIEGSFQRVPRDWAKPIAVGPDPRTDPLTAAPCPTCGAEPDEPCTVPDTDPPVLRDGVCAVRRLTALGRIADEDVA